ncbi:hypothetical protein M438DRAFT_314224 [Aureobasidium pullulans EXF-150]|uniref:GATA-type domain-containing protein n=1 Tax=Aureobasidium pullulans EXF-150 TaxID=1043002 RepID=A0A074XNX6_AURPU|nr:uncharacterized protein M438DRAFT_314224 [Aureobasidium pullulans EXF-150]KEQ87205.1 hypothetical protein M438DRAFT_314224 [Aureobasidium pullulans EXF-150]
MAPNFHIETENLPLNRSAGFQQKVLDGIQDLLMVLAVDGRILYSSPMSFPLIQVDSEKLVGHYMPTYMKVDDIPVFLEDFKDNMAAGRPWRYHHRLRRQDGTFAIFESTFKPYTENLVFEQAGLKPTKMCLMTSRPYPIPSTSLMDSFLEHCTTHIRLTAQLAKLKEESQTISQSTTTTAVAYNQNDDTIQTLSDASTSTKPQVDSVVGDVGIEITTSRLQTMQETGGWTAKPRTKKRKEGQLKEFLCKECGTADSPEWRRGPSGPKTLCNACGRKFL